MQGLNLRTVKTATGGKILRGSRELELASISTDTRTIQPGSLFFALKGETHDAHRFLPEAARLGAAAAVIQKKDAAERVPQLPVVLVEDTTRALGDLANWHRKQCTTTTLIGITGSNGKTTTKEMLFHILNGVVSSLQTAGNFNNAIGVPLTLFRIRPEHAYSIVEMGTNSPGEIARLCEIADPDIGLVTNVTETHLEGLGSVEGVAVEKCALLKHTAKRGQAFYNADNYWSRFIARTVKGTLRSFGVENEADVRAFNLRSNKDGISFRLMGGPRIRLCVPGSHNAMNALAAIAVARTLGIDWNTIAARLASFKLPPMRMELKTVRGVTLINDAYNANPVSLEAAARALHQMECTGRKILVVGDMLELGPRSAESHRKLGKVIASLGFDYLFGIGTDAAQLLASATKHGMSEHDLHLAASNDRLAEVLASLAAAGDTILFKGSRGMHLEEAIELLEKKLGTAPHTKTKQTADAAIHEQNEQTDQPNNLEEDEPGQKAPAERMVGSI